MLEKTGGYEERNKLLENCVACADGWQLYLFYAKQKSRRVSIVEEQIGNKEKVVQAQRLIKEEGNTITERFVVPSGYKRTVEGEQSFGMFLRNYR